MGMFFHKCSKCGTKVQTWQSYVDIILWTIGIVWLLYAQTNGYYERDDITITQCSSGTYISDINNNKVSIPITAEEVINENGELDTKKICKIANTC